jgi:hypothetical protein
MTTGPYFFSLRRDPECPYCRQTLLPVSVAWLHATAFCQKCVDTIDPRTAIQIVATQQDPLTWGCWSVSRGLLFFTPHAFIPNNYAAHFLPALIGASHQQRVDACDERVG